MIKVVILLGDDGEILATVVDTEDIEVCVLQCVDLEDTGLAINPDIAASEYNPKVVDGFFAVRDALAESNAITVGEAREQKIYDNLEERLMSTDLVVQ